MGGVWGVLRGIGLGSLPGRKKRSPFILPPVGGTSREARSTSGPCLSASADHYQTSLSPSWIWRDEVVVASITPSFDKPMELFWVAMKWGAWKFLGFSTLKNSARNCSLNCSVKWKFSKAET